MDILQIIREAWWQHLARWISVAIIAIARSPLSPQHKIPMTFILLLINLINYLDNWIYPEYLSFIRICSKLNRRVYYLLLSQTSLGIREKEYIRWIIAKNSNTYNTHKFILLVSIQDSCIYNNLNYKFNIYFSTHILLRKESTQIIT